jgi:hypothetical protein
VEITPCDQTAFFEAGLEAECGTFGGWNMEGRVPARRTGLGMVLEAKRSLTQGIKYMVALVCVTIMMMMLSMKTKIAEWR